MIGTQGSRAVLTPECLHRIRTRYQQTWADKITRSAVLRVHEGDPLGVHFSADGA